jgi:hypothetical protein
MIVTMGKEKKRFKTTHHPLSDKAGRGGTDTSLYSVLPVSKPNALDWF